eukprot:TRINITY_DN20495_c0_g1_i1.p1 TRINITY_DN20495_c0_g1~~TRINITY_DN20495_c0_g1_i1.p1  ORF type:complete len:953 (+),score=257.26 TRINITY_DN20495_c0_g1_i1:185-2860(+)
MLLKRQTSEKEATAAGTVPGGMDEATVLTARTLPLQELTQALKPLETCSTDFDADNSGTSQLLTPEEPTNACSAHSRLQILGLRCKWRRELEQETTRMHHNLVLQDLRSAMPEGADSPSLLELVRCWLQCGVLQAAATLRAQQQLQESTAGARRKGPEAFRQLCWQGALRSLRQLRPSAGDPDRLSQAVFGHWRNRHGICLHVDAVTREEFLRLLSAVKAAQDAEEKEARSAEDEALDAERSLLEELAAEGQQKSSGKSKKRKAKKEKQKCPENPKTSSCTEAALEEGQSEVAAAQEHNVEDTCEQACALPESPSGTADCCRCRQEGTAASRTQRPKAGRKRKQGGAVARGRSPPARQPADLESILEAVRKSEELHKPRKLEDLEVQEAEALNGEEGSEELELEAGVLALTLGCQGVPPQAPEAPAPAVFPDSSPQVPAVPSWEAVLPAALLTPAAACGTSVAEEQFQQTEEHEASATDQAAGTATSMADWPPVQRPPNRELIQETVRMSGEVNCGPCQTASASCALRAASGSPCAAARVDGDSNCTKGGRKKSKEKEDGTSTVAPSTGLEEASEASSRDWDYVTPIDLQRMDSGASSDLSLPSSQMQVLHVQQQVNAMTVPFTPHHLACQPVQLQQYPAQQQMPQQLFPAHPASPALPAADAIIAPACQNAVPPAPTAPAPAILWDTLKPLPAAPSWKAEAQVDTEARSSAEEAEEAAQGASELWKSELVGRPDPEAKSADASTGARVLMLSDLLPDEGAGCSAPAAQVPAAQTMLCAAAGESGASAPGVPSQLMPWQMGMCEGSMVMGVCGLQEMWGWSSGAAIGGGAAASHFCGAIPEGGCEEKFNSCGLPADHGTALGSWLAASGLPASGEGLAEILKAVAPETYED